jgi:hypothetical protein
MNWAAAAVMLGLTSSVGVAGEPRVLSDLELQRVTAAGVFVDVSSIATAFGGRAHTVTNANTFVVKGKWLDLGIGVTAGQALACCGEEADVEVKSAVLGRGDSVYGGARVLRYDDGIASHGSSAGFVVAVSYKDLGGWLGKLGPAFDIGRAFTAN